ncbi:HEAT repeat domain-containing protein [Methanosarcina sp. Z-7115]|uniref:HEAT repeat domain-containing protein n=2 Tax=Methanosarcina baikalica TaxID=3073890 RepID=A0ABU2D1I4_9EURY|nr:HEAT repeat domain-containing protein [Methanosarcina sp. Z-7115]MDR7665844.1 HEAT repeat domain-containing protein [Methanosarcina sp. Z-7115]
MDQDELLRKCFCDNPEKSRNAVCEVGLYFDLLPDKQRAWDELIKLISSEDRDVRSEVSKALGTVIQDVPDKEKVWKNLIILLTSSEFYDLRSEAKSMLRSVFQYQLDKQKAWEDLRELIFDKDSYVQWNAIEILGSVFQDIPDTDKKDAWEILRELAVDKKDPTAAKSLGWAFQYIPDKKQASEDIIKLLEDEKDVIRKGVVESIHSALPYLVDKQKVWDVLVRLTNDKNYIVSTTASGELGDAYLYTPNKEKAWNDIRKMAFEGDARVKSGIPYSITTLFDSAPDKHQAWIILHRLSSDDDNDVRWFSGPSIGLIFSRLSDEDKKQAWKDINRLVYDNNGLVRSGAAETFRHTFPYISIKQQQQASDDLHTLTLDKESLTRRHIAESIGFIFPYLPGKKRALKDLKRLESDEHTYVSSCAYHSLGKISIYNSSQATNEFDCKKELELAVEYFEKSAKRAYDFNPSQFCLPFYRSFQAIIFKENETEDQVQKYLTEAKKAIRGSNDKKTLYEAIKNLASALTEVENLDFIDKKEKLNSCRKYCEIASELMKDTEKTAPYATELIRKGLPILDQKLKDLLDEIQERAKTTCKESKGTATEEIVWEINKEIQERKISDTLELEQFLEDMAYSLKRKIIDIPENDYLLNKIELMRYEKNTGKKLRIFSFIIENLPTIRVVPETEINNKFCKLDLIYDNTMDIKIELEMIGKKLSYINFDIFKNELNSHNIISSLNAMKIELEKLNEMESLNIVSIEKLDFMQAERLNGLNNDMLERFDEIKNIIYEFSKNNDKFHQEYSKKLDELKQSESDRILQRTSAFITLIGFVIPMMITLAH